MAATDFYDRKVEALDRPQLAELQNGRLRDLIAELRGNRFYVEKARAAGTDLASIASFDDLERLPFTTKRELEQEQLAYPPFGRLLSQPLAAYRYFHQTSGTTGRPLRWLDTEEDWETWLRCWGCVFRAAGVTEHDIVFCAFSFGPYVSHWAAIEGARRLGALGISGGGMTSEQRLRSVLENRCTVLACTPTYALRLTEVAREHGMDLRSSSVRISIHAGEPGASVPNVKRRIEEAWNCRCFDHAGATEVGAWAFECQAGTGSIHLNEAEFIFEVVAPATGEAVPQGVRGELVVTTLGRPGMPVLRYRTGDLVELTREPCPCGRGLARIRGGVLGRADDMLIIRGVNVYPGVIDNVIRSLREVSEYEVEIRRADAMDSLVVKIETRDGKAEAEVRHTLEEAFRRELNLRIDCRVVERGSLPRYEFKARRYKRIWPATHGGDGERGQP